MLNGVLDAGLGTDTVSELNFSSLTVGGVFDNSTKEIRYGNAVIFNVESFSEGGGNYGVILGQGNDLVILPGVERDVVDAGLGNDTITAGFGSDYVNGGGGNDLLILNHGDAENGSMSFTYRRDGSGGASLFGKVDMTWESIERFQVTGTKGADAFGFTDSLPRGVIDGRAGVDSVSELNFSSLSEGGIFDNRQLSIQYGGVNLKCQSIFPR